ncbi:hypothetical protein BpHYR1_013198 [Brachionus plicatilis]|uniref:Uncharacterized protein n=1 Tax=Brachionus plicatilis TaxID=10195 RepID=A0A3M7RSS2_BRAPC|nr:hypothetical protein BpHYR1_013198 [Brachionus plicatilis]
MQKTNIFFLNHEIGSVNFQLKYSMYQKNVACENIMQPNASLRNLILVSKCTYLEKEEELLRIFFGTNYHQMFCKTIYN